MNKMIIPFLICSGFLYYGLLNFPDDATKLALNTVVKFQEVPFHTPVLQDSIECVNNILVPPAFIVNEAPIYPGCNPESTKAIKLKCFKEKISSYFLKNFNSENLKQKMLPGKYTIYLKFNICTNGDVGYIKVKGPNPEVEKITKEIIFNIPEISPAKLENEKKIEVSFGLPIIFHVN